MAESGDGIDGVTRWLGQRDLDDEALAELVSAVQADLRSLAAKHLRSERPDHTLQPTALVNEAYLRLVQQRDRNWENKRHFLGIASTAMRRVLLEHARNRVAAKRGGGASKVTLFDVASVLQEPPEVTIALDEALTEFAELDPRNAQIVELRWFVGLDVEETASALDVSTRTIERGWRAASAWLRARLADE